VKTVRVLAAFALVAVWLGAHSAARAASIAPAVAVTVNDRHTPAGAVIRAGHAFVAIGAVGSAVRPVATLDRPFATPSGSPLGEIFRRMRAGLTYDPDSREVSVMRGRYYPSLLFLSATATTGSRRLSLTTYTGSGPGAPFVEWLPSRKTVAIRVAPPSPQELAAEDAALAKIRALGQSARQTLDDAAKNLK
jgi:hypothetical protein